VELKLSFLNFFISDLRLQRITGLFFAYHAVKPHVMSM